MSKVKDKTQRRTTRQSIRTPPIIRTVISRYDERVTPMRRLLERMIYDDVLVYGCWRLEYLRLAAGHPHYRLMYEEQVIGIVDISSPAQIADVQRKLATYLCKIVRFNPAETKLVECASNTRLRAKKRDLPYLFK